MVKRLPLTTLLSGTALALLTLAGCAGSDEPEPLAVATSPALSVVATEMAFDPDEVAVASGAVPVELVNEGAVVHDLRVEGLPFVIEALPGERATDTVSLEPGRYRIFCSIPGHADAGMEGVLEVR